jgi:superfamily II DNA or RNA helicase
MPISWRGTLQQYVGRLHRLHDNKRVVQVYDYVDDLVPMLARMYERQLKGYNAIGYTMPRGPRIVDNCPAVFMKRTSESIIYFKRLAGVMR